MIFLSLLSLSGEGTCHTSASDRQLKMTFSEKKQHFGFPSPCFGIRADCLGLSSLPALRRLSSSISIKILNWQDAS